MGAFYRVLPGVVNLFLRAVLAAMAAQITTTNLHQHRNEWRMCNRNGLRI